MTFKTKWEEKGLMPLRQSTRKQKMKECKELFFVVEIQGIISEIFLLASHRVCVQFLCVHGDASGPVHTVRTPCNPDQGEEKASRAGGRSAPSFTFPEYYLEGKWQRHDHQAVYSFKVWLQAARESQVFSICSAPFTVKQI